MFDLAEVLNRPAASYSGGQRRRLEIARALVSGPRVLFLDEPTVGLDTRIRYELLDLISALRGATGMTTVLTTHYLDEAERLCDRIAVMHQGTIVALDRPRALLAGLGDELIELRVPDNPGGALAAMRGRGLAASDAFVVGSTLTVPLRGHSASDTTAAIAGLGIHAEAITTRKPTLDDVYLQLTGSRLAAIGVIVDRSTGARRELLAAPIPRALIVLGNLAVAIAVSLLQVAVLIGAGWLRGSHFHATAAGIGWSAGAVLTFTAFMYGLSEILANRIPTQDEYVGITPVVAILPWFIAGALFPITALPGWLAGIARALPTTQALALLRYGALDRTVPGCTTSGASPAPPPTPRSACWCWPPGRHSSPPPPSASSPAPR